MNSMDLNEVFAKSVATHPTRPALADRTREIDYATLDAEVDAAAALLTRHGVEPGTMVAVRLEPSIELVVALLAVLRTGACYLSLDPSAPAQRAELILGDARPRVIVEQEGVRRLESAEPLPAPADQLDRTAYVIYTSGTTGRPKGVPVTHRNVAALLAATENLFDFTEHDRWMLFHSTAFDFSVWEMWGAFRYGGRLFVPDRWTVMDPHAVAATVADERITVLNQTPTAFGALTSELIARHERLALRYVIFGGERLRPSSLREWHRVFDLNRVALVNMYGITEVTVHATFWRITEEDIAGTASAIGAPLPGFTAVVINEHGEPADRGELLLAGEQVVAGYLNRPELTADRFRVLSGDGPIYYRSGDVVEAGPDGVLRYLGRDDDQVKIRGHRIELGEVEAAFAETPDVTGVCALVLTTDSKDVLACAYTTRTDVDVPNRALRAHLRDRVPEYMIPTKIKRVAELPRNHNGKADRTALRALF